MRHQFITEAKAHRKTPMLLRSRQKKSRVPPNQSKQNTHRKVQNKIFNFLLRRTQKPTSCRDTTSNLKSKTWRRTTRMRTKTQECADESWAVSKPTKKCSTILDETTTATASRLTRSNLRLKDDENGPHLLPIHLLSRIETFHLPRTHTGTHTLHIHKVWHPKMRLTMTVVLSPIHFIHAAYYNGKLG